MATPGLFKGMLVACAVLGPSGCAPAVPDKAPPAARPIPDREVAAGAAAAWLGLVDRGDFGHAWDECTPALREVAGDRATFEKVLRESRPEGRVKTRTKTDVKYTRHLVGKPDGEYVRVVFETVFGEAGMALETVVMSRAASGRWLVLGSRIELANDGE